MKQLSFFILALLILLSGCKQSSDVVSSSFLQKRKYRKGFHLKPLKHKQDNPKNISLDSALCFYNVQQSSKTNLNRLNYPETQLSVDTAKSMVEINADNTKFKDHLIVNWPPILQRRSEKLENAQPNEIDPVDKEQIEKSKKRLKISSIAMAITSIPGLVLLIIAILGAAAILPEAVLSIIVLFTLISTPILIFFSTVALVYLLERILNKSDRSLFRTKFREFAAIASIVIGIAAMLFLVLSGGLMGLLMYLVLINLFNELAWLVPLFGIFVSGIVIAGIYAVLAWLNTIFIAISFKEFKKSLFSIIGHVVGWIAGIVAGIVVFIALLLFVV